MSRCFPYPPPYCYEPLVDSVQLQKEREKKKWEKEKREKANRKHKKRKYEEKSGISDVIEQLERSGITEEHELPCSVQYKHDFPESSQDSNKRIKVLPSVSSHNKNYSSHQVAILESKFRAILAIDEANRF